MTKNKKSLRELRLSSQNPELRDTKVAAKILKISCSTLYKIEQGYRNPSVSLIDRMSKEYCCSVEDIFFTLNITDSDETIITA